MYGIFDVLYHEPWSKHIARRFTMDNKIRYTREPVGRVKGCFDTVVKLGRRNVIRIINKKGELWNGHSLHFTVKGGGNKFRRQPGTFYPGFLKKSALPPNTYTVRAAQLWHFNHSSTQNSLGGFGRIWPGAPREPTAPYTRDR